MPAIGGYSLFGWVDMDEDDISDEAKAEIARIRAEQKADPRGVVSRADAAEISAYPPLQSSGWRRA